MTAIDALEGKRILILEDDFYLAREEKTLLEQAGAAVVGPFGTAFQIDALINLGYIDAAVVDINLGRGPTFDFARILKKQRVPFVFVTGYDAATIPPDMSSVERLEKPILSIDFIAAIKRLCTVQ